MVLYVSINFQKKYLITRVKLVLEMDCSTTMNSCRPTHKKSIPCILGDMLQESLQFVSTLEENHENTTGTVNNVSV